MKIAYIHDDKKINTGAHHINDLIVNKLRARDVIVKNVYPKSRLIESSNNNLKGVSNILYFYSLLEQKKDILKYDLIQGTTYTPITFLAFDIPVVSHFGSTTKGFICSVPKSKFLEKELRDIWFQLKRDKIIAELEIKTKKPMMDIAEIEFFVASKASKVIATSKIVKQDLIRYGHIPANKIRIIYNAIEDYWFEKTIAEMSPAKLIFLGRIGQDVFTWKLKGLDRLVAIYKRFPDLEKLSVIMSTNKKISPWLDKNIPQHKSVVNFPKDRIRHIVNPNRGSIYLLTSRYEGFSLSLIEAMSQGLIPVAFPVGVAPEIIINGQNGFLINSIEEASLKIQELLGNESLRFNMSQAAYLTSLQFKADLMAKKLVSLYEQLTLKSTLSMSLKQTIDPDNILIPMTLLR